MNDFTTMKDIMEMDFENRIVKMAFHGIEKEGRGKFKFVEVVGMVFKKD